MAGLRKITLQQYGQLYHRLETTIQDQCWYCGDTRECLDHVPSLGLLPHTDIDKFRENGGQFLLVPCCNSCNSLLANRRLYTPNERISWLLGAYHKLFDKSYYGWSDAEVKEMGYTFRLMINAGINKSNSYIGKIRSIERRILDIENFADNTFHGLTVEQDETLKVVMPVKLVKTNLTPTSRKLSARFAIMANDGTYLQKEKSIIKPIRFGPLNTAHQYLEKAVAVNRLNSKDWPLPCTVVQVR